MYTNFDFETKKALKEAVARLLELEAEDGNDPLHPDHDEWRKLARRLSVFQPGPFGGDGHASTEGRAYIEGPQYPKPHKWYAEVTLRETNITPGEVAPGVLKGVIVKVK